jgi:YD repeat-containing protein
MKRIYHAKNAIRIITFFFSLILLESLAQDVSVDPLSGKANVVIPIYSLKYGATEVPINLRHSGTALMIEESDGDAGLGWNLSCHYGVYRQVRGLPDELPTGGWLNGSATTINNFTPTSNDDLSYGNSADEVNDYNTINALGYQTDSEPDLYTVTGPGLYFQFVYDANGQPRLLEYQDVKITRLANNAGFTVKNNTGQTFQFNNPENITRQAFIFKGHAVDIFRSGYNSYALPIQFVSSWHLTSVVDPVGNTVNFNYTVSNVPAESHEYKIKIPANNVRDTMYYFLDKYIPQTLTSITAGNYAVNFKWTMEEILYTLSVSESGLNDSFQYSFVYQQAQSSIPSSKFPVIKHFLIQILPTSFSNATCVPEVPYRFSYQGITLQPQNGLDINGISLVEMPWNNLYSQDMWGYYNGYAGAASTQSVPQLYFYSSQTDSRRFSLQTIPNNTLTTTFAGANRFTQASKIGLGSLVQIMYPTGGSTKIIWERNKYLDSLTTQVLFAPGQRVAQIVSDAGEAAYNRNPSGKNSYHQIVKNYTYTKADNDTTSSGIMLYPPEFAFATGGRIIRTPSNQSTGSYVSYRRVKESTVQGSTVYVYSLPAMYPSISYSNDWSATKSKIARNPSDVLSLNFLQNGYYTFPFAPNPNYSFAQGLLQSVSEYSTSGALVRQKQYSYSRINPALQSVYGLKFEYMDNNDCDCFHFSKYQVITGVTNVLTKQITTEISETNSNQYDQIANYYHYNSDVANNNFLMDSVRTVWGDGSVSRKKIKYVKDFAALTNPVSGDAMANAIPALIAANRHGEVVEEFSTFQPIGGTASTVGASLQLFQVFNGKILPYKSFTFPEGFSFTPATIAAGATQGFSYNSNYLLTTSLNDFDAAGHAISISDNKQNKVAQHYPLNYSLGPVATFANATALQTVYDGFEFTTGRNLTPTSALTYTTGWTGQRAAILTSGNVLTNSNVGNAAIPYRVSCWVNATQNATVTFQFSNLSGASTVLNYTTPNQWVYLEGIVNVASNTPSTLTLQITSNATITIDDIVVLPRNATVSTQTFLPLKGPTSKTDDRGNSTTVAYDALGRKVSTFDRQRNLIEMNEYLTAGKSSNFIGAFFTYTKPVAGLPFTASINTIQNCFNTISYQWKIDDVPVGSSTPTLTSTIATPGRHTLELIVTNTASMPIIKRTYRFL